VKPKGLPSALVLNTETAVAAAALRRERATVSIAPPLTVVRESSESAHMCFRADVYVTVRPSHWAGSNGSKIAPGF
jgi:hypothetical protein